MRLDAMVRADDIRWTPSPAPSPTFDNDEDLLVVALCEADGYRELARAALHDAHDRQQALDRLRDAHHHLIDEYRQFRERVLREDGVCR